MAKMVEIEVEVTASGEVHLQVKGTKGKTCLDLAKPLEEALGVVEERKLTSEYYESEKAAVAKKTR